MLWVATASCDLPPIGFFTSPDASVPDDVGDETRVCEPRSRRCVASSVHACNASGTDFSVEPCEVGDTCNNGQCEAIANTCDDEQPFALNATEFAFEATRSFKEQSQNLTLRNCTTRPLHVRNFEVRGPIRPDGAPVFVASSNLAGELVAAGASTSVRLTYRPSPGLAHVTGAVVLGVVADQFATVEIALRSKAVCVTATPFIDLGMRNVGTTTRSTGFVQNCGTEAIAIDGFSAPAGVAVEFDDLPKSLAAGAAAPFEVTVAPSQPQLFDGTIALHTTPPLVATTRVRAWYVPDTCAPVELVDPLVVVDHRPSTPTPGSLVGLRFPQDPEVAYWLDPLRQPQGSYARLQRSPAAWSFRPRIVGQYRTSMRAVDLTTGEPSCDRRDVTVRVAPADGLTVELSWQSTTDVIPQDTGFGRSANLDLHVARATPGRTLWNDPAVDCWPEIAAGCVDGTIYSSQGGIAEVVQLPHVDGPYQVGVYLSNPFNFRSTLARVRVFRDQALVADLESTSLRTANDFWLVGHWDEETATWSDINSVFSGFPY